MPPKRRKIQSNSASVQGAIVRWTPTEVEDDIINDETNENESLNQEEASIGCEQLIGKTINCN